jgi:hypothetical protein
MCVYSSIFGALKCAAIDFATIVIILASLVGALLLILHFSRK